MTLSIKKYMFNSQYYPWNFYLIKIVDCGRLESVINSNNFSIFSSNRNAQVTFVEKPQLKIIIFQIKHIDK